MKTQPHDGKAKGYTRERLPALLGVVLAGCLAGLAGTPAAAQTTLLEVDDNLGHTIFHVLVDGRVLLPIGAASGYVLTTDGSGYATWQPPSGPGGPVSSDATLVGDGTAGAPLGVAVPLALTGNDADGQVRGTHALLGNVGALGTQFYGTYGQVNNGWGAYGEHANGHFGYLGGSTYGAYGQHTNGHFGYLGSQFYGAYGESANGTFGLLGFSTTGVFGQHTSGHFGRLGDQDYGAYGENDNGNLGRLGASDAGVFGSGNPWAGRFDGDVEVTGTLTKGGGSFRIDHPLDPANRYLSHSFVESPDMMNVYNGNTTTDAQGYATVELPSYFEALNRDFRYQLTVLGQFAQAIVAEEIQGNWFVIRTDQPGVKVSWQVTGIRQDPWAEAHRIVVEADKPAVERGYYLHPALYGQPAERSVEWARDSEGMREMQAMPARIEAERAQRPPSPRGGQR